MRTLLVVEDREEDLQLLREYLDPREFTILWVANLRDALTTLTQQKENIELILLDLGLPESSGISTLRHFSSFLPTIPLVVLSGLDDDTMALSAIREGADDYIVKRSAYDGMLRRRIHFAMERHARVQREITLHDAESRLVSAKGKIEGVLERLTTTTTTSTVTTSASSATSTTVTPSVFPVPGVGDHTNVEEMAQCSSNTGEAS